mmetsp:Transcript_10741/g.25837  ORF Transcript_10741/g.25837 Transcript_10741/m.25837 type:complete len:321 (-) Transcript_10741:1727-2689(-)
MVLNFRDGDDNDEIRSVTIAIAVLVNVLDFPVLVLVLVLLLRLLLLLVLLLLGLLFALRSVQGLVAVELVPLELLLGHEAQIQVLPDVVDLEVGSDEDELLAAITMRFGELAEDDVVVVRPLLDAPLLLRDEGVPRHDGVERPDPARLGEPDDEAVVLGEPAEALGAQYVPVPLEHPLVLGVLPVDVPSLLLGELGPLGGEVQESVDEDGDPAGVEGNTGPVDERVDAVLVRLAVGVVGILADLPELLDPSRGLPGLADVEDARVEDLPQVDLAVLRGEDLRLAVERSDAPLRLLDLLLRVHQVGLVEEDDVRELDLLHQ